ncbi:MAG: methyltransferase domain-containing protein, partial [Candidatus Hodarchaeota archaeon]
NSVDVISGFSLLHHFQNPREFFEEAFRVLKPKGFIYTDWDPNAALYRLCGSHSQSGLFKKLRPIAMKVLAAIFKKYYVMKTSVDIEAVAQLAEYHHFEKIGLEPSLLVNYMKDIGYREVEIYYHDNSDNLFAPFKIRLLTRLALLMHGQLIVSDPHNFARFFSILSAK